jgi:hypothetical protein
MVLRLSWSIALAIGLSSAAASCGGDPAPEGRTCARDPAALDRLDRALARCAAGADCPCGARCTTAGTCTYDCRDDAACAEGQTCTLEGRCAEVAP